MLSFAHRPPLTQQGAVIFALQILLVILIPALDDGERITPLSYSAAALCVATLTVLLLGYRRTAATIAVVGVASLVWELGLPRVPSILRLPLWLTMIGAAMTSAALCIKTAFSLGIPPVQRIFCGAASFVLIGFVFASVHAMVGVGIGLGYALVPGIEVGRDLRWVDVVPVTAAAYTICTLEGLCGILFPATLIARIASIPGPHATGAR
jgi:hypothetical protein